MISDVKIETVEVAPGIWAILTSILPGGGPNGGIIIAEDEIIVIDPMMSQIVAWQLHEHVMKIAGTPATYLINTHNHGDHLFGNQVFSPPATIIAHENVRNMLLVHGDQMVSSFARKYAHLVPDIGDTTVILPHITYSGHMTLTCGERTIELIHPGPAHTNGDTMVFLPREKVLFSGDIFFDHVFPPIFGSSTGWITALDKLQTMDIDIIVPGHGNVCSKTDLVDLKQCLIELRSQVTKCYQRKLSPEQAIKEIDLAALNWPFSDRLGLDIDFIYKELEQE